MSGSFSKAQTISFLGGLSVPGGLYASKDFTQKDCGLALPGYHVTVIFDDNRKGRAISPFIQYTFNTNKMDEGASQKITYAYDTLSRGVQSIKPWTQNFILIGPRYNYYGNDFDLYAKAGIGMGWLSTYAYNIYYDSIGTLKNKGLSANALVFSLGIGANIYINSGVSVCLGYEYFYAQPDYGIEKLEDVFGRVVAKASAKFQTPFQSANFYAGLRFQLKRNVEKTIVS